VEEATSWLESNSELVKLRNEALRCIAHGKCAKVVLADMKIKRKPKARPLCSGWFVVAIHQMIMGEDSSKLHRDIVDYRLTCLASWGNHTKRDIVLAQLELIVEIWPDDVFLSRAR
jgi:hypothetical protein